MITRISSFSDNQPAPHVVFVHGLGGDGRDTWQYVDGNTKDSFYWPEALSNAIPNCHVLVADYLSGIFASPKKGTGADIDDIASALTEALLQTKSDGPFVFVCHSLGGIVTKQLLFHCAHSQDPRHRDLLQQVRGLIFLGTPHQGSDLASFLDKLTSIGISKATQILKRNNAFLKNLQRWFATFMRNRSQPPVKIHLRNYYESLPTKLPGFMVVPEEAAQLNDCNITSIAVLKDHIRISKPHNTQDMIYLGVLALVHDVSNLTATSFDIDLPSLPENLKTRLDNALEPLLPSEPRSGKLQYGHNYQWHMGSQAFSARLLAHYLSILPASRDINFLPPLLGTRKGLPIATMYVELTVSPNQLHTMPSKSLAPSLTLAQAMEARHQSRKARRLGIKEALDDNQHRHIVILGEPGGGKSSLLKRISLDVAGGKWQKWFVPFIIPLRLYWQNRQRYNNPEFTLLRYITLSLYAAREQQEFRVGQSIVYSTATPQVLTEIHSHETLLTLFTGTHKNHIVFLLDGFDEIAADDEARENITRQINDLSGDFSWIVTSRRAGFSGELNEDICYDVVELDDDNIELLTQNWFAHQSAPQSLKARQLLAQVMNNDRLLMMARNPFLLTLLCYLQTQRPGNLPLNRHEIYGEIFDCAIELDKNRRGNNALKHSHLDHLSEFCLSTYRHMFRGPWHLFTENEWNEFNSDYPRPDLLSDLCPTRLLDQWSDRSIYHLVHLTLHEYMVATAIAKRPAKEAIDKLYHPAWRVVLRFVASMWWHQGQHENFKALLEKTLNPLDYNGMNLLPAAWFLLEAGLSDSTPILGFDLREQLWQKWLDDEPYISDAAADALAVLSPEYGIQKAIVLIENTPAPTQKTSLTQAITRHYNKQSSTRDVRLRAISLLGKIRHEKAQSYLFALIENEDQTLQLRINASQSLAMQNTQPVRSLMLSKLQKCGLAHPFFALYCETIEAMAHNDFTELLASNLMQCDSNSAQTILHALTAIATASAATHVIRWYHKICSEEDKNQIDTQTRQDVFEAIVASRSNVAEAFFTLLQSSEDNYERSIARYYLIKGKFLKDQTLFQVLDDLEFWEVVNIAELLGDEADAGWVPSEQLVHKIREFTEPKFFNGEFIESKEQLQFVIDAYAKLVMSYFNKYHINLAGDFFRKLLLETDFSEKPDMRSIAIYTCAQTRDILAAPAVLALAAAEEAWLCRPAIEALANMEASPDIFALLHHHLRAEKGNEDVAADSLAQLDMEQALQMQEHPAIQVALSRLAAEKGLLLFDTFYVDKMGVTTGYQFNDLKQLTPNADPTATLSSSTLTSALEKALAKTVKESPELNRAILEMLNHKLPPSKEPPEE